MEYLIYLIFGALAGLLSGLLGIGGGLVLVPTISFWQELQGVSDTEAMQFAVATSLASVAFITLMSAYQHIKNHTVLWHVVNSLSQGLILGAILGVLTTSSISGSSLQLFFGCFSILIAIKLFLQKQTNYENEHTLPSSIILAIEGVFVGFISALLGLGGGIILVPLLRFYNLPMRLSVGTSSVCSCIVASSGLLFYLFLIGKNFYFGIPGKIILDLKVIICILATSLYFSPIGVRLSTIISNKILQRIFAVCLLFSALRMIF